MMTRAELRSLYRQGLLAEWQQGSTLEDPLFRAASDIRMSGNEFDSQVSASAYALSQYPEGVGCWRGHTKILPVTPGAESFLKPTFYKAPTTP